MRARLCAIGALLTWTSVAAADQPAPTRLFVDLAPTIEIAPTQPGSATRVYGGVTTDVGYRERWAKVSSWVLGGSVGVDGQFLANRVGGGLTFRLNFWSFEHDARELPEVELYAFAAPWIATEDVGSGIWELTWGTRMGLGLTAIGWSERVAGAMCGGQMGDGPPVRMFFCFAGAPVWGPVALLNHVELYAQVAKYPNGVPLPGFGVSFGTGF
jgi:hypothetical protein